jgi:uncharacterized membrane protein HdeD (DUF308 family)
MSDDARLRDALILAVITAVLLGLGSTLELPFIALLAMAIVVGVAWLLIGQRRQ